MDKKSNDDPGAPTGDTNDAGLSLRSIYLGIFLVSSGVLLLEISLTRVFSYTIWYHFTYVTISLAMLGFGASGAVLAASERLAGLKMKLAYRSSLIAAISVPFMLIVISQVPFNPFQLFKERAQIIYMIVYYMAVTLPFFCAGLAISCGFRNLPQKTSTIYFWDLVGAGMGCFLVVAGIKYIGAPGVIAICGSLFLLAGVAFSERSPRPRRLLLMAAALVWIPIGLNVEQVLEFKANKEKAISKTENKTITFSKWSPIFRVDAYEFSDGRGIQKTARSIYGIRRKHLPADMGLAFISHDGDSITIMIEADRDLSNYEVFDKSLLKTPYLITDHPKVLIIGPGGGLDVGVALQSKARSVVGVELDPITVDIVANKYADYVGHLYDQPGVEIVIDEGRSFLRRSEDKFDLIQMTGVATLSALNSGAYVLAENYVYTVEAYNDFMDHLTSDGVLSVAFFDFHYKGGFPKHTVRLVSLSMEALKQRGIRDASNHIAVLAESREISGTPFVIILTKLSPFTPHEIGVLRQFAQKQEFDTWYLPGKASDNPCGIAAFTEEEVAEYYEENIYMLMAPTDDTPFFFHFYKWKTLFKWHPMVAGDSSATGQLVLLIILVFSLFFSAVFIIFPLYRFRNAGLQTTSKRHYILYFSALGMGFMFLEISYIQRFILFLGYPTYSLTVILFSLLTFSGIGSYLSGKLPFSARRLMTIALALLSVVALGYIILLPQVFNHYLSAPIQVRIAISILLLFPLGLLLGIFFPAGIKIISIENPRFIPWAWGINGCASVIGTVLSIIIAMTYGFSMVTILAVLIYIVGVSAMLLAGTRRHPKTT